MSFFFVPSAKNPQQPWLVVFAITLITITAFFSIRGNQPAEQATNGYNYPSALKHLQQITRERHPVGSTAHDRVRDYLIASIRSAGYEAQTQAGFAVNSQSKAAAQVENILVRVPADSTMKLDGKALLIAAHYDAVPNSFGAGDAGVSVANLLQTLASLKQQGPRSNDVIFLFSDAEEVGLVGAIAFAEQHPWMRDVGMVLNFDNRGDAGPVLMFETSAANGKLIAHFAQATPQAVSNSVMYEVYKALPNDTDFSVFRKKDIPGLNFAMIDNFSSYHTRHDTAEALSPASQQQQGALMQSLVHYFANQDLTQLKGTNAIYFSLPLIGLVHYSSSFAIPLALLLCLAAIALFVWQRRTPLSDGTTRASLWKSLAASLIYLVELTAFAFLAQRVWTFITRIYPEYASLRDPDNGHYYLLALVLLFITIFAYLQKFLCRWFKAQELSFGVVWVWSLLLLFSSVQFAGASFLFAIPLFFVLFSWAIIQRNQWQENARASLWSYLLGILPGVLLFAPFVVLITVALGFYSIGVPILLMSLLLGLSIPLLLQFAHTLRRWVPLAFVKLCVVLGAIATANFHNVYPEPNQLMYVSGAKLGDNWWASPNDILKRDTLKVFTTKAEQKTLETTLGPQSRLAKRNLWLEQAPDLQLARPVIQVQKVEPVGDKLKIQLLLQSPLYANNTGIAIEGVKVFSAQINQQKYESPDPDRWSLLIHGRNREIAPLGNVLELEVENGKRFTVRISDTIYQMPETVKAPALPDDFLAISIATLEVN